jgi:hypothetical protein
MARKVSPRLKKIPPFGGTFQLTLTDWKLAAALALLVGVRFLARSVRVLLLLSGFLATTLLLAGLLIWILILLARILVLAGHSDLPC